MHEAAIAQSILINVERKLRQSQASAALAVKIVVGEFRNVDPQSLQFAFNNMKADFESCDACELIIEIIKAVAECRVCRQIYEPTIESAYRCMVCHGGMGKLIKGEELDIISYRLEAKELNNA